MSGKPSPPEALVHIGTAKTGTTALQHALLNADDALRAIGVAYLPSPGHVNARELAAASVGPTEFDDHLDAIGATTPDERRRFHDDIATDFGRHVASTEGASRVVISSEHLHSRLTTAPMVERFLALIGAHVGRVRVLCYLRPQAGLVESFYSTHLRNGGTKTFDETVTSMLRLDSTYCNYEALLSLWADALGDDAIDVRIFDRSAFVGGTILSDAETALAFPAGTLAASSDTTNAPIDPDGQRLLLQLNRAAARGDVSHESAREMASTVADVFAGPGERLDPNRAAQIASMFESSNEQVRRRFRPDLETLFTPELAVGARPMSRPMATSSDAERAAVDAAVQTLLGRDDEAPAERRRRRWPRRRR